jgi:hypothetical protein
LLLHQYSAAAAPAAAAPAATAAGGAITSIGHVNASSLCMQHNNCHNRTHEFMQAATSIQAELNHHKLWWLQCSCTKGMPCISDARVVTKWPANTQSKLMVLHFVWCVA